MKIIFCLGSLSKGGAERVVCNLSNYFISRGDKVEIIVTRLRKKEYYLDKDINVIALDSTKPLKMFRNLRRVRKLYHLVLDYEPDLVFCFLQEPIARYLVLKTFCRRIRRIPVIISVRIDPKNAFKTVKRRISKALYNKADGFVFQTNEVMGCFKKSIQQRGVIIANSIDELFFSNSGYSASREKRIVAVGRLVKQKNYQLLVDAFETILPEFRKYTLEIYGDGPLKDDIYDYIVRKGLEDNVKLMGVADNIKDKIESAALFVMSSDYEGMSNALMEAMALGLPCVSTNSAGGGAASLIKDGVNGFLVPVNDPKSLSEKMKTILSNPVISKQLSENARQSMMKYNPNTINAKWAEYAEMVVKRKGG